MDRERMPSCPPTAARSPYRLQPELQAAAQPWPKTSAQSSGGEIRPQVDSPNGGRVAYKKSVAGAGLEPARPLTGHRILSLTQGYFPLQTRILPPEITA